MTLMATSGDDLDKRAFQGMLPKLQVKHAGKFALFHGGEFVGVFDSMSLEKADFSRRPGAGGTKDPGFPMR